MLFFFIKKNDIGCCPYCLFSFDYYDKVPYISIKETVHSYQLRGHRFFFRAVVSEEEKLRLRMIYG